MPKSCRFLCRSSSWVSSSEGAGTRSENCGLGLMPQSRYTHTHIIHQLPGATVSCLLPFAFSVYQIFREALPSSSERSVSIQGTEEKICDVIDYILEQLSGTKVCGYTCTQATPPPPLPPSHIHMFTLSVSERTLQ